MKKSPSWQYNEFSQVGTDYDDPKQVEAYDTRHSEFRDVKKECENILDIINISPDSVLIELGTGTGAFAIYASRHCSKIYAVDVSKPMLKFAEKKAKNTGTTNIVFCHAGFLTYDHQGQVADAIVSSMALHHLTDFWKAIAFNRMNGMLKEGGKLFINDVVFEQTNASENISKWIKNLNSIGGKQLEEEVATHIREEYSTFDWILEGLLERSGFKIISKKLQGGVVAQYLCVKEADITCIG